MRTLITSTLFLFLTLLSAPQALASVTVTAATGGANLSADQATNGAAPAFTTLGNIVIAENAKGDFAAGNNQTLILTAPTGWQFRAATGSVSIVANKDITSAIISVSSTTIVVTLNVGGIGSAQDAVTITGIQVRSTEGGSVPGSGNILRTSTNPGTAIIAGITNDSTNFGSLSQTAGASRLYVVLPGQAFNDASTLAASSITGVASGQTAGVTFNITKLVAADRQFNISTNYSGAKTISYSGPGGITTYTTAVSFTSGQSTTTLATTLRKAETTTLTATDGTVAGIASSPLTVVAAAATKLQVLLPGEVAAPGTATGKTGSPTAQSAGIAIINGVIVRAVDANWNINTSATPDVALASSDLGAMIADDNAGAGNLTLATGTGTLSSFAFATAGTQTVTAVDAAASLASNISASVVVNKSASSTAVASSQNPSAFGQSVTFTATVSGGVVTPTGTVTFKDGATTIGSSALNGSAQATFATNLLSVAAHPITAIYAGNATYTGSTSAALTQTVNKASSTTAVASSVNPSVFGQSVTFTATVSTSGGTPTGTVTFKDGATTLGTGTLSGGQATFATSSLATGSHPSITAVYGGDSNFDGSTSPDLSQTVNQADTTTTVASSVNPSGFGQSVTFTATVSPVAPGAGTRTGNVTFTIDGTPQTPAAVNASGQATFATSTLSLGDHTVTATYNGDVNFTGSTSADFTQTVSKANTTTTITSSANPSAVGQPVTLTATVGPTNATGTVTFNVDGVDQTPASLDGSGQATLLETGLTIGDHTIVATYSGDGNFNGSISANFTQTVQRPDSTTTVSSSLNPSVFGDDVTFTAIVSGSFGTPTGTATFRDGATTLGTGTLDGSGETTFTTNSLTGGIHLITAEYGGDGTYTNGTSAVLTQTVNQVETTTTLISDLNPSVFGQSVTFTATVSAVSGTPTGSVIFHDDATTLGTNTLAGGVAIFTTSSLAAGSHTNMTAAFTGDINFTNSTSGAMTQEVTAADTTTTLASSANPSVFGQSVVFTSTVSAVAPGVGTPTGTVTFSIDGTPQTPVIVNGSGQATLTNALLSVAGHTISATYDGDANFNTSTSADFTQTVNMANSSTTVSSSTNPSALGQSVTFTATVSPVAPGAGTRTGTLTFTVDGVGQTPVSINVSGQATFSTNSLSLGAHTISADYSGDGNFNPSTSTNITQTVNQAGSTTTVSSSVNPSVFGQSVSFTATVSGSVGTPTGTVTFKDGAATLGTGALDVSGQTTFITSSLAVGSHPITAVFSGDGNYNASTSSILTQTVNKANTTTALSSSGSPVCLGQPVTFTADVSAVLPGVGTPAGTVTFRDGATSLGSPTLSAGQATLTTSTLPAGNRVITATYNGSSNFNTSVSVTFTQTVNSQVCSITGAGSLCANATGNTYTAPAGMGSYSWSVTGNGTIPGATNGQSVSVDAGASGSFTVNLALTGTNTCTSSCSLTVTINTSLAITTNPTNRTACAGTSVSFSAAASGSSPSVQWQASSNGGASFTNIAGATSSTYTFTASLGQNGNQYRAVFSNPCSSVTSTAATLTVNPPPVATITASSSVCANSTSNSASVANAGVGAVYVWSISGGGTITSGNGTPSILYSVGGGGITLNITITNAAGCFASGSTSATIPSPGKAIEGWRNKSPLQWQSSTFNDGDHKYSDGNSIPYRLELTQMCAGGGWCVVLQYDFADANTPRHFYDFFTTYNASESTVNGQECTNFTCNGTPTTFPIPADTNLTYQLPGNFTVYNGAITNVSTYTTVSGSTIKRQLTITGTTDPGTGAKDVLVLFGGHLARENEWGVGNGAHSFPGASAKVMYKFCSDSSFGNFSVNPGGIIVQADVGITKTDSPDPVCPGGVLTYSINVTNHGPNQATSVAVLDPLPAKTTFVSATPSQGTFTGTTNLNFSLGSIDAGSNATITIVVNVATNATGILTNTATVSAAAPADPFILNNTATATTTIRTSPSCLISGPNSVCPLATTNYTGPAGMATYGWSISGNGSITGATNTQTVTVSATSAGSFTLGLSVTDSNGCSSSGCSLVVTVVNSGAPLLTCPGDRQLQCGDSTATNNTGVATASGSCGGGSASISYADAATLVNCTGLAGVDRTWMAVNSGGQTSTCIQHITFVDTTPPLITCPGNKIVNTDPGSCTASNVSLGSPSTSDNCSGVVGVGNNAPLVYPKGTTIVVWTATDACGNSGICSQSVTVVDNQAPTITCPAAVTNSADAGQCFATSVALGSPITADNCAVANVTNDAPAQFPVGNTTVHWVVIDSSANSNTCSQAVTINDTELPTIICTNSIVTNADFGGCTISNIDLGTPVTSDNCGIAGLTSNAPTLYFPGITNVIWTVTDIHGNSADCTQMVTVVANPPVCSITGPSAICVATTTNYSAPAGLTSYDWSITGNGTIGGGTNSQTVTVTATNAGSFTLSLTVSDTNTCGSSTCQQTITVIDAGAPLLSCADDRQLQCGESTSTNNTGAATASGACGGGSATVNFTDTATPPSCTGQAGIDRIWTATNLSGQSSICTQHITFVDTTLPTITCAAPVAADTDPGQCTASSVSLGTPIVDDNCGVASVTNNAPASFPVGTSTVIWTVSDGCGNSAICSQTVTVTDNQTPTITCPAAMTNSADAGQCYATGVALGSPITGDNCGVAGTTNDAPAQFPVGNTTVHWTVADVHGHSNTCSQAITILDTELPTIICTNAIVTNADFGACTISNIDLGTPITSDNCGVASLSSNVPAVYFVGITNVIWTVTDIHGNSADCTQLVTVVDGELPTISCPANVTTNVSPGLCSVTGVILGSPLTSDNCGVASVTNDAPDTFVVGTTNVTWTVIDLGGNSNTCIQSVTVLDTELPVINCPATVMVDTDAGQCSASGVALGAPVTSDNCNVASVTNNAPAQFSVGTNTVTWTVTDVNGNSNTCTQSVIVRDTQPPTISCPASVNVNTDNSSCFASGVSLGTPTTGDNCAVASVTNNAPATFPVGTTFVTWTVSDVSGNTNSCQQSVIVTDNQPPTISCPAARTNATDAGHCYASGVALGTPVTSDNCSVASITNNAPAQFPVGTTTVHWVAIDASGNTNTCSQSVIVIDNRPPTITCPANVVTNTPDASCPIGSLDLGTPNTTDNCSILSVTNNAPATFSTGTTLVIWTVTDASGNQTMCTQQVIVTQDSTGPCDAISCYRIPNYTGNMFDGSGCTSSTDFSTQPEWDGVLQLDADSGLCRWVVNPDLERIRIGGKEVNVGNGVCGAAGVTMTLGSFTILGYNEDTQECTVLWEGTRVCGAAGLTYQRISGCSPIPVTITIEPCSVTGTFEITAIAKEGNNVRVTWKCGAGRTNFVQVASGRANGSYSNNFTDLSPQIILNNTPSLVTTNYLHIGGATNAPARYYRIRLLP